MKSFQNFWHQARLVTEQICPATLDLQGFVSPEAALPALSQWQDVFRGDWECKSWTEGCQWLMGLRRNLGKIMEDPGRPPLTTFLGSESISLGFLLICPEFARRGRHMRPGDLGLVLSPFQDTLKSGLLDRMVGEARTPSRSVQYVLGQRMRHWDFSFHHGRCCFASSSKFEVTSNWHT